TCRTCVIFSELSCPSKLSKLWGPLQDADLSEAELWWAEVHIEDLDGAHLCRTIMPDGQTLNRDCSD
ncbi:MAG: hypothetical protein AAFZ35_08595, partial [Cyanobacteria bacterium J06649_12]